MKKRFKKLDAIAAALLVGTVGTMALSQVADPPTPVAVHCPGGTYTFPGTTIVRTYDKIECTHPEACALATTSVPAFDFYFVLQYCAPPPA